MPTYRRFRVKKHPRFVRPAPGDVAKGVAPATKHQQWHVEAFHVRHTVGVPSEREVEAAKTITWKGVCPALHHDRLRGVVFHNLKRW